MVTDYLSLLLTATVVEETVSLAGLRWGLAVAVAAAFHFGAGGGVERGGGRRGGGVRLSVAVGGRPVSLGGVGVDDGDGGGLLTGQNGR